MRWRISALCFVQTSKRLVVASTLLLIRARSWLGRRAVPTRRKYVRVGSRSPSMATRRSAQPCTPDRPRNPSRSKKNQQQLVSFRRCVGMTLLRPFDAMDGINEPTRTYSRRVVAGSYQRRGLHRYSSGVSQAGYSRGQGSSAQKQGLPRNGPHRLSPYPEYESDWVGRSFRYS